MNLGFLIKNFENSGFDDLEQILYLMNSKYPITDKILLEDIGIEKLGHRHRILSKLNLEKQAKKKKDNFIRLDRSGQLAACEFCVLM